MMYIEARQIIKQEAEEHRKRIETLERILEGKSWRCPTCNHLHRGIKK